MGNSRLINGFFWSAVERLSTQGIQFVLSIIIARMVIPAEYGLIAMLSIFLAIAQTFVDSGFSYALIQKQDKDDKDFSTVFIFSTVISFFIYLFFYLISPYISDFYGEERLISILRASFLVLIINALGIVQRTNFIINYNFKVQAKISIISVMVSGICGIVLAYYGYGVWALVFQSLISSMVNCVLLWVYGNWHLKLSFSVNSFLSLFSFGSKILCTSLLDTIYVNIYNILIGKFYSSKDLGLYNRAFTFSQFPSRNIYNILNRVMFPKLCEFQNNTNELTLLFIKYIRMLCFIIFPIMMGIAVLSDSLVIVVLSDKWIQCAPYLSILCIAYMFYPLMASHFDLVNSMGYPKYTLRAEIVKKIAGTLIILLTIFQGITILCLGIIFNNIMDIIIMTYYSGKISPINLKQVVHSVMPIFLLNLFMVSIVFISTYSITAPLFKLVVGFLIGLVVYVSIAYVRKFPELKFIYCFIIKRR